MHGLEIVKCREAMRLFPVAPFLTRIQQKSLDIDGFEILQWEILKELENDLFILLFLSNFLECYLNLSSVLILRHPLLEKELMYNKALLYW
jgi:hypothetical protein